MITNDQMTDDELLLQLKNGITEEEEAAFRIIYNRYKKYLFVEATYHLDDASTSEDIVQDLFSVWWESKSFRGVQTNIKSYMKQSVRYACCRENINKKKSKSHELIYNRYDFSEARDIEEFQHSPLGIRIQKVLDEMSDQAETIFKEVFYHLRDRKEVIQEHNITGRTLTNKISLTIGRIRQTLQSATD